MASWLRRLWGWAGRIDDAMGRLRVLRRIAYAVAAAFLVIGYFLVRTLGWPGALVVACGAAIFILASAGAFHEWRQSSQRRRRKPERDPHVWTSLAATPGHRFSNDNQYAWFTLTGLGDKWARGVTFRLYEGNPPTRQLRADSMPADYEELRTGIRVPMWPLNSGREYTVKWTGNTRWDDQQVAALDVFTIPTIEWDWEPSCEPLRIEGEVRAHLAIRSKHGEVAQTVTCIVSRDDKSWSRDAWDNVFNSDLARQPRHHWEVDFPVGFIPGDRGDRPELTSGRYEVQWTAWNDTESGIGLEVQNVLLVRHTFTWPGCHVE
jgi:hypothetical protein